MAPKLIKFANDNPTTEKSFGESVNSMMKEHFPQHYDSVDTRTVIMFLQSDFKNNGYVATSLKPFRILKK